MTNPSSKELGFCFSRYLIQCTYDRSNLASNKRTPQLRRVDIVCSLSIWQAMIRAPRIAASRIISPTARRSSSAKASANLYSLIETAKANGLEPNAYLRRVFTDLPNAQTVEHVEAFLPWNVKCGVG